ncbi:STM4013/SEN3800 family hydrolase [uncultured Dokdonia sp.]|uniref:STM4013/SEN3800 family hydrolase n=1 Tax=uncultured Dokdonia sp. TaxID=575653 RepID=UPI00260BC66B|nr:STM4013/SEN3800 family hydrolase [uncultured Dokdonia sp.]
MNINKLIPHTDIVFITLDSLRYDAAQELFLEGQLPNFEKWLPKEGWEERYTPASFTFPAHHAFFSGFLPTKIDQKVTPRLFAAQFHGSESTTTNTYTFTEDTLVAALANQGYKTVCIGGVGFFNKQTAISNVFPNMFQHSEWSEKLGVTEMKSTAYQFQKAVAYLQEDTPVFLFINISATHQPTHFYVEGKSKDDIETHKAALRYVDTQLEMLQKVFKKRSREQFIIVCSDHGTAYGEDDHWGHRNGHDVVMKVPYLEYLNRK